VITEQYAFFPTLNATLNGTSAALLLSGRILIARGRIAAHRACMIAAVVASALFLACYLFFHFQVGNIRFLGEGWARPVYFSILISHVTLAIVIVPLAIISCDHHLDSWPESPVPSASRYRALDLASLDVRFCHGRDCVFHALSVVPARLSTK
jgi:hypothetical protein